MADDPSKLTVHFELSGRSENVRITEWRINSAFLTSTDGFSFTIVPGDEADLRDLELQPVELLLPAANGTPASQVFGRIDSTEIGSDGTAVSCAGRDYLSDIVECNVDPAFVVKEGMSVGDAITLVCQPCGIDSVISDGDIAMENIRTGSGQINPSGRRKKDTKSLQDYQPRKGGEGIYEFCNRIAARHGCTIQPGNARNVLVLTAPDYRHPPVYEIRRSVKATTPKNNVMRATAKRDYSRFPTFTLVNGANASRGEEASKPTVKKFDMLMSATTFSPEMGRILSSARIASGRQVPGKVTRSPGVLYRFLHINDDHATSDDDLLFAGLRGVAERLKDTLEYRVTLKGHVDPVTGLIWTVNTMVHVVDELCGIDEDLWISERTFSYSQGSGATTELTCWRPDSFQIEQQ